MSNTVQHAAETAAAAAASSAAKTSQFATYAGSASAVYFGLTANELAAVGGLLVGALGMIINAAITIYFKREHLKLAREKSAAGDD